MAAKEITEHAVAAYLDLSAHGLQTLSVEDIAGYTAIKALYLNHNELTQLPDELGDLLPNLTYLDLRHNKLTGLPRSVCLHPQLRTLLLGNNCIAALPALLGQGPSPLKSVNLAGNPLYYPSPEVIAQGWPAIRGFLAERLLPNEVEQAQVDAQVDSPATAAVPVVEQPVQPENSVDEGKTAQAAATDSEEATQIDQVHRVAATDSGSDSNTQEQKEPAGCPAPELDVQVAHQTDDASALATAEPSDMVEASSSEPAADRVPQSASAAEEASSSGTDMPDIMLINSAPTSARPEKRRSSNMIATNIVIPDRSSSRASLASLPPTSALRRRTSHEILVQLPSAAMLDAAEPENDSQRGENTNLQSSDSEPVQSETALLSADPSLSFLAGMMDGITESAATHVEEALSQRNSAEFRRQSASPRGSTANVASASLDLLSRNRTASPRLISKADLASEGNSSPKARRSRPSVTEDQRLSSD